MRPKLCLLILTQMTILIESCNAKKSEVCMTSRQTDASECSDSNEEEQPDEISNEIPEGKDPKTTGDELTPAGATTANLPNGSPKSCPYSFTTSSVGIGGAITSIVSDSTPPYSPNYDGDSRWIVVT